MLTQPDSNADESNDLVFEAEVEREIYDSVNDAIFVHDGETGEIIDVNETASELYGYPRAELRQLSVEDLSVGTPPYTQETAVEYMQKAAAGEPQVFEWRAETKGGDPFWVEVSMRRAVVESAPLILVIVRDISERKRKERELERSEARYRSLTEDVLDTSNVAIIILDADFEVVWANQATLEYFGINRDKLIGSDKRTQIETWLKDIFEDPDRFAETLLATYDDNTYVESFECHLLPDSDRNERWLEHWSHPIETVLERDVGNAEASMSVPTEREAFLLRELSRFLYDEDLVSGKEDRVLVVAARRAWPEYQETGLYFCQANRSISGGR